MTDKKEYIEFVAKLISKTRGFGTLFEIMDNFGVYVEEEDIPELSNALEKYGLTLKRFTDYYISRLKT